MSAGPSFGSAPMMMMKRKSAPKSAIFKAKSMSANQMAMPPPPSAMIRNSNIMCDSSRLSLSESDSSSVEDLSQTPQQNIGKNIQFIKKQVKGSPIVIKTCICLTLVFQITSNTTN